MINNSIPQCHNVFFYPLFLILAALSLLGVAGETSAADAGQATDFGVDLRGYLYSDDQAGLFDGRSSNLAVSVDMTLSHRFNDYVGVDFAATGFVNALDDGLSSSIGRYFEDAQSGVFFTKANLRLSIGKTTLVAGRDTLETPLFQSLDRLLAPAAFDVVSVENSSLEYVDFFGAYVFGWRQFNEGNTWTNLSEINAGGNWMLHAGYSRDRLKTNLWFYEVNIGELAPGNNHAYNQLYGDADYDVGPVKLAGQFAYTWWRDKGLNDSLLTGCKVVTTVAGLTLTGAYQYIRDAPVGYVEADSLYASAWGTFSAMSLGHNVRLEINRHLFDVLTVTVNSSWYQYDQYEDSGHEFDLILTWQALEVMNVNLVFYNTDYTRELGGEINALELFATYHF